MRGTPAVCLVGKTHDFHVHEALGASRWTRTCENIRASVAHLVASGARRCSTPSISSTATPPTRIMRWPACARRWMPARAGSCCATPMAARCPHASGDHRAVIAAASPATGWASIAMTIPAMPWPALAGRRRCRRAPDPGHAERAGRALRQCQPDHADPDPAAEGTLCAAAGNRRHPRGAGTADPHLAPAGRDPEPRALARGALCRGLGLSRIRRGCMPAPS
jgi:hypothetical protein